jgi:hypothetical protein
MARQRQILRISLTFILAISLQRCGGCSDSNSNLNADTGTLTSDSFVQTGSQDRVPVDILFVLSSWGTLSDDRRLKVAKNLPLLLGELDDNEDFTIAFALGWGGPASSGYDGTGRLYQVADYPLVLTAAQSTDEIGSALRTFLGDLPPQDPETDGGDAGLYSLHELLTSFVTEAKTAGTLRTGAALAVVFISPENDICALYPEDVSPVDDPDGIENQAKDEFCSGITAETVVNQMRSVKGSDPSQVFGLVYTNLETMDPIGEEEIGYGYLDAIYDTEGLASDLAACACPDSPADVDEVIRNIGNSIDALVAQLQRKFVLTRENVNPMSIKAFVDDRSVTFRYIESENAVLLDYAGHEDSTIKIEYRVLDE